MKNRVEVEILGNKYNLRTDSDPNYIKEIADYLTEKLKEISQGSTVASTSDISILAALNITDELFKLRKSVNRDFKKLYEKTNLLVEQIDEQLELSE